MKAKIGSEGFDGKPFCPQDPRVCVHIVVYDINAREADEVSPIIDAIPDLEQSGFPGHEHLCLTAAPRFIFCSSAGVYLKQIDMPHMEEDPVDPNSRHKVFKLLLLHLHLFVRRENSKLRRCWINVESTTHPSGRSISTDR